MKQKKHMFVWTIHYYHKDSGKVLFHPTLYFKKKHAVDAVKTSFPGTRAKILKMLITPA